MLCERLDEIGKLGPKRHFIAEPKLDGQRAQLHIAKRRAVACYGRLGHDLLRHPGMAWLKLLDWPVRMAVLDGEVCAGDGREGIHAVLEARQRPDDGSMSLLAFDILILEGRSLTRESWRDRRKQLEALFAARQPPRTGLVPVSHDPAELLETWLAWGGEGIVLKDPTSIYRPGVRSPSWLKVKPKLELSVLVTGGSATIVPWGDSGAAITLEFSYVHPRSQMRTIVKQAVRVPRDEEFTLRVGQEAELLCWGVMPSTLLRHPQFVRWVEPGQPRKGFPK